MNPAEHNRIKARSSNTAIKMSVFWIILKVAQSSTGDDQSVFAVFICAVHIT